MKNFITIPFTDVELKDKFWSERLVINQKKTLAANYQHLKKQGRIDAWTWKKGQPTNRIFSGILMWLNG